MAVANVDRGGRGKNPARDWRLLRSSRFLRILSRGGYTDRPDGNDDDDNDDDDGGGDEKKGEKSAGPAAER